jgi:hypothetical protein
MPSKEYSCTTGEDPVSHFGTLISLSGNTTVIEAQGAKYVFDHQMIQVVA